MPPPESIPAVSPTDGVAWLQVVPGLAFHAWKEALGRPNAFQATPYVFDLLSDLKALQH